MRCCQHCGISSCGPGQQALEQNIMCFCLPLMVLSTSQHAPAVTGRLTRLTSPRTPLLSGSTAGRRSMHDSYCSRCRSCRTCALCCHPSECGVLTGARFGFDVCLARSAGHHLQGSHLDESAAAGKTSNRLERPMFYSHPAHQQLQVYKLVQELVSDSCGLQLAAQSGSCIVCLHLALDPSTY